MRKESKNFILNCIKQGTKVYLENMKSELINFLKDSGMYIGKEKLYNGQELKYFYCPK